MGDRDRLERLIGIAGMLKEDITEARSRRDAAKGRVEQAAARLGYCSVDAPISGIVLTTNVSRGQLVSTMVPVTLLTMVDDSTRRVRAFVDESEISKICLRQRAHVTADAVPGIYTNGRHRRKHWRYSRPRPVCQRFLAAIPSGDAVGIWRPAADADWAASVSSILAVCRWAGRFQQVTCAQKPDDGRNLRHAVYGAGAHPSARSFTAIWNRYASSNAALSRSGRSLRATVSQASRSAA
jgi:HlyD family secretion protein